MSGPDSTTPADDNKRHAERLEESLFEVKRVIVGQDRMVERAMICANSVRSSPVIISFGNAATIASPFIR